MYTVYSVHSYYFSATLETHVKPLCIAQIMPTSCRSVKGRVGFLAHIACDTMAVKKASTTLLSITR